LSTINAICPDLGSNPDLRSGKPATNSLSYGAAQKIRYITKCRICYLEEELRTVYVNLLRILMTRFNRLCSLVERIPGYRSRGPRFDSRLYHIFYEVVDLERGPLSLMRIIQ
jgi:hypothetical protein